MGRGGTRDGRDGHRVRESADREIEERTSSTSSRPGGVSELQQQLGNQVVKDLHDNGDLQASLAVSQPGDPAEREAERVAEELGRMPDDSTAEEAAHVDITRPVTTGGSPAVDVGAEANLRSVLNGGRTLPDSVRSSFEAGLGRDLSDVRVHTGKRADDAARSIDAEAFTLGTDIAFARGNYRPNTRQGRELLAHELTHVVQQTGSTGGAGRAVQRQESETLDISEETEDKLEAAALEIAKQLAEKAGASYGIIAAELGYAAAEGVGAGIELARAEMQREESRHEMDLERIRGTKHLQEGVEKLEISASERYEKFLEKPVQVDRKYMARAAEKLHIVAKEMFIKIAEKGTEMISAAVIDRISGGLQKLGDAIQDIVAEMGSSTFSWLVGYSWDELIQNPAEGKLEEVKRKVKNLVEQTLREKFDQVKPVWEREIP